MNGNGYQQINPPPPVFDQQEQNKVPVKVGWDIPLVWIMGGVILSLIGVIGTLVIVIIIAVDADAFATSAAVQLRKYNTPQKIKKQLGLDTLATDIFTSPSAQTAITEMIKNSLDDPGVQNKLGAIIIGQSIPNLSKRDITNVSQYSLEKRRVAGSNSCSKFRKASTCDTFISLCDGLNQCIQTRNSTLCTRFVLSGQSACSAL